MNREDPDDRASAVRAPFPRASRFMGETRRAEPLQRDAGASNEIVEAMDRGGAISEEGYVVA